MSVQVAVAAPAVELKELGGPMDKACEPVGAHSAGHGVAAAAAPACPVPGAEREAAPAPSAERPPGSGCPGLSSAAAGLSSAAAKVPQASAMKRSDPHHPQHRHRDGSDSGGGGAAAEALVSPDGSVTEAPRTVKKTRAQDV
ncbi:adenosylhomocysteinase 3-like [Chamaea fasciata]|uniref:adenosylhomocysteinase 3-like n=1 Tax=Chamaea fasciata TaxID=190680 RepID=UPI00336A2921